MFDIRVDRPAPDRSVLWVRGEFDMAAAGQICAVVPEGEPGAWVIVDLSGTSVIDSSAVKELVDAHRLAAGRGHILIVRNARGIVNEVLHITGVARLLGLAGKDNTGTVYGSPVRQEWNGG